MSKARALWDVLVVRSPGLHNISCGKQTVACILTRTPLRKDWEEKNEARGGHGLSYKIREKLLELKLDPISHEFREILDRLIERARGKSCDEAVGEMSKEEFIDAYQKALEIYKKRRKLAMEVVKQSGAYA